MTPSRSATTVRRLRTLERKIITRPERLFQLEPVVLNYFEEISSQ